MLVELAVGEALLVGEDPIRISMVEKSGRRARLKFEFVAHTQVRKLKQAEPLPLSLMREERA